ncbi:MAG: toll/interleukin-1 receptor domain-containing protein [Geminicoccaceae bacterium]
MADNDHCPVCLSTAERGQNGDRKQVRCTRCGPFAISGTALALLRSRLDDDPRSRARLSHAIRSNTSEAEWLFVSSANLDELVQQPLPAIPRQLEYLARWLAGQLGDDRFGRLPCPWPETLAGIVGAVDGDRVTRLIEHAVTEAIVEHDAGRDILGLSPKGWAMAEPPQNTKTPPPKPHVFLSHVREDADRVERLATDLKARGIETWIDRHQIKPGQRWEEAIAGAIRSGAFFVACFSQAYAARSSSYMNEELHLASKEVRRKSMNTSWFIPIRLDDCEIPDWRLGQS